MLNFSLLLLSSGVGHTNNNWRTIETTVAPRMAAPIDAVGGIMFNGGAAKTKTVHAGRNMKRWKIFGLLLYSLSALSLNAGPITPAILGIASSFAVLAGSTVTNTGATVISGILGVYPGTAITNFPPGVVINRTQHAADAVAAQAHDDAVDAYRFLPLQS
jgi:hypothetical protein